MTNEMKNDKSDDDNNDRLIVQSNQRKIEKLHN